MSWGGIYMYLILEDANIFNNFFMMILQQIRVNGENKEWKPPHFYLTKWTRELLH